MVFLKGADEYLLAETGVRCLEDTKLGRAAYEVEEGNMLLFNPPFHKNFLLHIYLLVKFYVCFTIGFSFQCFKESILFLTVLCWLFSLNLFLLLEYKFSHDLLE